MPTPPPTVIIRHRKERLSKCSLHGLESRPDLSFHTFPEFRDGPPPDLTGYVMLTLDAPPLDADDEAVRDAGLVIIDGTWRLEQRIRRAMHRELFHCTPRSLPTGWVTAYPRRQTEQTECADPDRGLASVEALYIAHRLLGRNVEALLDHYVWREQFFELNAALLR
ncbi:MAG: hypothetical protein GC159_12705 [Phycisphaera sp.]|nr:hypothetical protein [Phycisphaera sp.]